MMPVARSLLFTTLQRAACVALLLASLAVKNAQAQVMSILPPASRTPLSRTEAKTYADSIYFLRTAFAELQRDWALATLDKSSSDSSTKARERASINGQFAHVKEKAETEREETIDALTMPPANYFAVFADGALRNAVNTTEPGITTGSLSFLRRRKDRLTYMASLSLLDAARPRTRGWGASLLAPSSGQALTSGLFDLRLMIGKRPTDTEAETPVQVPILPDFPGSWRGRIGVHLYASASSYQWRISSPKPNPNDATKLLPDTTQIGATVVGGGAHLSIKPLDVFMDKETPVSIVLDAGLAVRALRGDFAQSLKTFSVETKLSNRTYWGSEWSATLQYRMIRFNVTYYAFGGDVPGFSGGQLTGGAGVSAPIFSREK